ncbi:MptD family putative ECF transporter S component [Vagococcus coleopterorum]|uniref:MptD family putative ECF transporter S component n=1 Tax=Vagococcus coleopterorum TaxID=2714946 RepID=A0A6G8AL68_9ENTE|nr:MptD family putative ECF transporter S component [Vagococcus coleopterorum]QIL45673.1 MptD family putative ECF transporter S component [Vagococcus coleopterorum]
MSKKLNVKDLITIGSFSALYFIVVGLVTFATMVLFPSGGHFFLPAAVAVVVSPIYFLLHQRVPKLGAITIMSSVMGVFFMVGGYFPLAFVPAFLFGFLADLLVTKTSPVTLVKELIAYVIFSFGVFGPILPLVFMQNQYVAQLLEKGKDQAYVDQVFKYATPTFMVYGIIATLVCALISGYLGQKYVAKHFNAK